MTNFVKKKKPVYRNCEISFKLIKLRFRLVPNVGAFFNTIGYMFTRPRFSRSSRHGTRKYASSLRPPPRLVCSVVVARFAPHIVAVAAHVSSPPRSRCVSVHSSARDHAVLFLRAGRGLTRAGGVHRAPGRPAAKRHLAERRRPRAPRHRHAVQRVLGHTDREQRVPVRHGRLHVRGRQPGAQRRVHCPSERQRYPSASAPNLRRRRHVRLHRRLHRRPGAVDPRRGHSRGRRSVHVARSVQRPCTRAGHNRSVAEIGFDFSSFPIGSPWKGRDTHCVR